MIALGTTAALEEVRVVRRSDAAAVLQSDSHDEDAMKMKTVMTSGDLRSVTTTRTDAMRDQPTVVRTSARSQRTVTNTD